MSSASKYRVLLWQYCATFSTRLSIAVVLGFALLPPAQKFAPAPSPTAAKPVQTAVKPPSPDMKSDSKGGEATRAKLEAAVAAIEARVAKEAALLQQQQKLAAVQAALPQALIAKEPPAVPAVTPPIVPPPKGTPPANEAEVQSEGLLQLTAARRRAKKQAEREVEFESKRSPSAIATEVPKRKPSRIATAEQPPGKIPVSPPEGKGEQAKAEQPEVEPPKPDVWTDQEVITALKECVRLLGPIAADIEVAPPVKHEQCGAPAPVMLRRIGSGANKVEINPPAMLNCAMVVTLHNWVEKTLQPAAMEAFGSPVARLRNASGYSCRNRNGSVFNSDKLSEHAKANAIDIAGFVFADGRAIEVVRHWGPTVRDLERIAAEQAKAAREAKEASAKKPEPVKAEPTRSNSAIATVQDGRQKAQRKDTVKTTELHTPGRTVDAKAVPVPPSTEAAKNTAEAGFLRRLHKGACGVFGTVLGPEANEAHRDHFHFDLAARRRNAYCE